MHTELEPLTSTFRRANVERPDWQEPGDQVYTGVCQQVLGDVIPFSL